MNRDEMLLRLEAEEVWDVLIVGGGATGLGVAVDAVTRGYRTLLLEQADFASATSSRSTKLVHGGVRYLEQGDLRLVMEALHERGLLHANAPHVARNLPFSPDVQIRVFVSAGPRGGGGYIDADAQGNIISVNPS